MARYNRWFNQRLYDACERLSDEERKWDRGVAGNIRHRKRSATSSTTRRTIGVRSRRC